MLIVERITLKLPKGKISDKVYLSLYSQRCRTVSKKADGGFPGGAVVKNLPPNAGDRVRALVREDPTCRGATKSLRHNYESAL